MGESGDSILFMRISNLVLGFVFAAACTGLAEEQDGIKVKLCGAFEQPGTYSINRKAVHVQDILSKARPVLLARKDLVLVVDGRGERMVDLSRRDEESLLRGGEQVYLYERIMARNSQ